MITGLNNDVFGYYKQGDAWAITKNGEYWIGGIKSLEDAKRMVEMLDRDQEGEACQITAIC